MKVMWRAYAELADGHKMYVKQFIAQGNNHHDPLKTNAQHFTTEQKNKLKNTLPNYYWERVLKSDRKSK